MCKATRAVVVLCIAVSGAIIVETGASQPYFDFSILTNNAHSSVFKRLRKQAFSDTFSYLCIATVNKARCSSSYTENYIKAISKCGDRARTRITEIIKDNDENICQQNSAGQYCGADLIYYANTNCTSSSSCPVGCLISLKQAGCCVNLDFYPSTTCSISKPPPCSKPNITVPTITSDPSCCSEMEFINTEFAAGCDNMGPIFQALSQQKICQDFEQGMRTPCSSRNGQYCLIEFNITSGVENSVGLETVRTAIAECSSIANCSSACKSSLISVKNAVGCCLHAINATEAFPFTTVFDVRQWDQCGVSVPKQCDSANLKLEAIFNTAKGSFVDYNLSTNKV